MVILPPIGFVKVRQDNVNKMPSRCLVCIHFLSSSTATSFQGLNKSLESPLKFSGQVYQCPDPETNHLPSSGVEVFTGLGSHLRKARIAQRVCSHRTWGFVGRWDVTCGKLTRNSASRREVPMKLYGWYFGCLSVPCLVLERFTRNCADGWPYRNFTAS